MKSIKTQTLYLLSLIIFPLISYEFLPIPFILALITLIIIRTKIHFSALLVHPIAIALVLYIRYKFGTIIVPETTISFLAVMCLARILGKNKSDYKINRLLGFLWAGCFILFRTDLFSVMSLVIFTLLTLKTLHYHDNEFISFRKLFKIENIKTKDLFIGLILVVVMFVFFPRIYNFLPGVKNAQVGTIGYSKTINNSNSGSVIPSSQVAFYAEIEKLPNDKLYWRGRVHNHTDGYNWRPAESKPNRGQVSFPVDNLITYKIKYEQSLDGDLVLLDTPVRIKQSNLGYYKKKEENIYKTYSKKKKAFIEAISSYEIQPAKSLMNTKEHYLQLPLLTTKALKPIIDFVKRGKDLKDKINLFAKYILDNEFSYTLSPKNVTTLKSFIENKEGFCTHYASLLGITLRKLGYPTRLVSGFQGGIYNEVAGHYRISSNDAHAWVEVHNGKNWSRIDPTSFISPLRIQNGGESFFTGAVNINQRKEFGAFTQMYYKGKQYIDFLNYRVSLFFDTYDRDRQRNFSESFKINRKVFIIIGLIIFIGILAWFYFATKTPGIKRNTIDKLFLRFEKKLSKKGLIIRSTDNLTSISNLIHESKLKNAHKYIEFLKQYEQIKYAGSKNIEILKDILKELR